MRQALWSSIFCALLTLSASNAARSAEALIDAWQEPPPSSQTARPVWVGNGCWLKWRCGPDGCGWRRFCQSNQLAPSMSRRGNCWDNAVAESFFSSMKKERIKKRIYPSRDVALADIAEYIDHFYNPVRRHSHLAGVSPEQFEAAHRRRRRAG